MIHGGLYYPSSSLKARFCVDGKNQIYNYCRERQIPNNPCGKLVVATNQQQFDKNLQALKQKAIQNGVTDVRILSRDEVRSIEPDVECVGALLSPSTGVLDSHSFFLNLLADAEDYGATLVLQTSVDDAEIAQDSIRLHADGTWIACKNVINSTGLWAHKIAKLFHTGTAWQPPTQYFAKGTYFRLEGRPCFRHLIYPIPEPGGLGVHATIDWSGFSVKFGPDVEWVDPSMEPDRIGLNPDSKRGDGFYDEVRKYWPRLPDGKLVPDYVGIRPKLQHPKLDGPNLPFVDFCIAQREHHGISGLVHLLGIESPGLTSSMAIGDYVRDKLRDQHP